MAMSERRYKNFTEMIMAAAITLGCYGIVFAVGKDIEKQARAVEQQQAAPAEEAEAIQRPAMEYKAQNLRDPYEGYKEKAPETVISTAPSQLPALSVTGVVWGGDVPQAIINGKVFSPGEEISGVKIITIDKYGVKALFEGKPYEFLSPAGAYLKALEAKSGGKNEKK